MLQDDPHRQAPRAPVLHWFGNYRLAGQTPPPGATPVLAQYWFFFHFNRVLAPHVCNNPHLE